MDHSHLTRTWVNYKDCRFLYRSLGRSVGIFRLLNGAFKVSWTPRRFQTESVSAIIHFTVLRRTDFPAEFPFSWSSEKSLLRNVYFGDPSRYPRLAASWNPMRCLYNLHSFAPSFLKTLTSILSWEEPALFRSHCQNRGKRPRSVRLKNTNPTPVYLCQ